MIKRIKTTQLRPQDITDGRIYNAASDERYFLWIFYGQPFQSNNKSLLDANAHRCCISSKAPFFFLSWWSINDSWVTVQSLRPAVQCNAVFEDWNWHSICSTVQKCVYMHVKPSLLSILRICADNTWVHYMQIKGLKQYLIFFLYIYISVCLLLLSTADLDLKLCFHIYNI